MTFGSQIPDKTIAKQVNQKLARSGGSQSHVTTTVRNGDVTLTGTLQYEHARRSILNAANGISGVRRVIDQMRVIPKKTSWA